MRAFRWVSTLLFVALGVAALGCQDSSAPVFSEPPSPAAARARESGSPLDAQPIVTVTPVAAATINQYLTGQRITGPCYLRVRVLPGGCCGFLHKMDLEAAVTSEDHAFESGGVKVVVLKRQVEMLRGAQVDYGQEGDQQGFKIHNPNFEGESLKKWLPVSEKDK